MYGSTEQRSPGLTFVTPEPDGNDFHSQFVAGNSRVTVERHLAEVAADIRPADADAVDTDDASPSLGGDGSGISMAEDFRFLKLNGTHGESFEMHETTKGTKDTKRIEPTQPAVLPVLVFSRELRVFRGGWFSRFNAVGRRVAQRAIRVLDYRRSRPGGVCMFEGIGKVDTDEACRLGSQWQVRMLITLCAVNSTVGSASGARSATGRGLNRGNSAGKFTSRRSVFVKGPAGNSARGN